MRGLRRILNAYAAYYNELRTHRSLNKNAPIHRAIERLVPSHHTLFSVAFTTILQNLIFGTHSIRDRPIAFRSPWQNAYVERLIGSIRRECLDHMIVFGEAHLRRILGACAAYCRI